MSFEQLRDEFPEFYRLVQSGQGEPVEEVLPGASETEVKEIEQGLGVALPSSYKAFLRCCRGVWLSGGAVQFGQQHPFFHDFPAGVSSPSQGMLCFGEFFREGDGDQVLFDVSGGMKDDEYPVMYYAHENHPPTVKPLAPSFRQWLTEFLKNEEFADEDQDEGDE